MRDLARYRARSGPALAAISLSTLIAAIICVVGAARFSNVLDDVGPNLTSSQLIVYPSPASAPGATGNKAALLGRGARGATAKKSGGPSAPVSIARARPVADDVALTLGTTHNVNPD